MILFPQRSGGISQHGRAGRNILRDDRAGADDGAFANRHTRKDGSAAADAGPALDKGRNRTPVGIRLQLPSGIGSPWDSVVNEGDSMTDKNLVFDGYGFANKRVRRDLAEAPDAGVLLNFDEGADLRAVADLAAVEIDEVMNDYLAPQLNVGRDDAELAGHETGILIEDTMSLRPQGLQRKISGPARYPVRQPILHLKCNNRIYNSRNSRCSSSLAFSRPARY